MRLVIVLITILAFAALGDLSLVAFANAQELYINESATQADLIQTGVERSSIQTGTGLCWIK